MDNASLPATRRLVEAGVIAEGAGTYYDIRRGRRTPSFKLALDIYRVTGERYGPLADLTEEQAAMLRQAG